MSFRTRLYLLPFIVLASCGYHLVGQGDGQGAIAADVATVSMRAEGSLAQALAAGLKRQLERNSSYAFAEEEKGVADAAHAEIRIEGVAESFVPSAYDQSGIALQYRMTLSGRVRIFRQGKAIWDSGVLSSSGDVFVSGGPAGIEASRERIRSDLQKEWIQTMTGRIRSGF